MPTNPMIEEASQNNDSIEVQLIIACHDDMVRVTPEKIAAVKQILTSLEKSLREEIAGQVEKLEDNTKVPDTIPLTCNLIDAMKISRIIGRNQTVKQCLSIIQGNNK